MEQEFVSLNGKVIVNRQRLLIKVLRPDFRKTAVGEISFPVLVLALVIFSFVDPHKPFGYLVTAVYTILFFTSHFKKLYTVLFRKTYSGYIPSNSIISIEVKPDDFGLETEVLLHLKNGRYRSIVFRTLEKQYEGFIQMLSGFAIHPQLA